MFYSHCFHFVSSHSFLKPSISIWLMPSMLMGKKNFYQSFKLTSMSLSPMGDSWFSLNLGKTWPQHVSSLLTELPPSFFTPKITCSLDFLLLPWTLPFTSSFAAFSDPRSLYTSVLRHIFSPSPNVLLFNTMV